jgi:hypothetical protein
MSRFLQLFLVVCLTTTNLLPQPTKSASKGGGNNAGGTMGGGVGNNSGNPVGGATQGGATYFETQMLAYGGVNQIAAAIADQVCRLPSEATVILYDQASFQNLQIWESFQATVAMLTDSYATMLTDDEKKSLNIEKKAALADLLSGHGPSWAGAAGFGQLSGLVGAIAGSTTNNPATFTIQDSTMAVSIAHQVKRCAAPPKLIYYPIFGSSLNGDSTTAVTDQMTKLNQARAMVQNKVLAIPASSSGPLLNTSAAYSILQDLNSQYDLLIGSVLNATAQAAAATAGTAPSGLTSLVQGADLQKRLEKATAYILYADVVAAGGTQIDRKNVLTVLFTGDWISYSGGLVVNVAITHATDNSLWLSDTLRYRSAPLAPWATIGRPHNNPSLESVNTGDNLSTVCNQDTSRRARNGCAVLASIRPAVPTAVSGDQIPVTVALTGPAPAGGLKVALRSPEAAIPATSVVVPEGQKSTNATLEAPSVSAATLVEIVAEAGTVTRSARVKITPQAKKIARADTNNR